jgi:DNA-binding transcriptional regulator of glucitol operon
MKLKATLIFLVIITFGIAFSWQSSKFARRNGIFYWISAEYGLYIIAVLIGILALYVVRAVVNENDEIETKRPEKTSKK